MTIESLPSIFTATRCVFLSTAPMTGITLSASAVVEVSANDAFLVDGKLDDLVGLGLCRFGNHRVHSQGQPLFVLGRLAGICKLLGLVIVLLGRSNRLVAVIDSVIFVGHVPAVVVIGSFTAATTVAACRAPAPRGPGRGCHRPLARPPSAGITAVPARREGSPAGIGAIDGRPSLAADELPIDKGCAAAGRDHVSARATNAGDATNTSGTSRGDPADSGRSGIAPLISGCRERAALSIAGRVGISAADIGDGVSGGIPGAAYAAGSDGRVGSIGGPAESARAAGFCTASGLYS